MRDAAGSQPSGAVTCLLLSLGGFPVPPAFHLGERGLCWLWQEEAAMWVMRDRRDMC